MQAGIEGTSSRELKREMRMSVRMDAGRYKTLPESGLWSMYVELRKRGETDADHLLLRGLKTMLERRTYAASNLPVIDPDPNEHKQAHDPYLGELFKAYKRCVCTQRVQPASQLLRDIEMQLVGH